MRVGPAAGGEAVVEAIGTLALTLQLTLCDKHALSVTGRTAASSPGGSAFVMTAKPDLALGHSRFACNDMLHPWWVGLRRIMRKQMTRPCRWFGAERAGGVGAPGIGHATAG